MISIPRPTFSAQKVFEDCVSIVRSTELKGRLSACGALIVEAEIEFNNKMGRGQIHTILREKNVNGNVSATELVEIYSKRMVKNLKGRIYYDKLLLAAPQSICPLCGHRDVTTLDHYLPKTEYPRLSVVPINLVPSCKDCNSRKGIQYPITPETEVLNPYFDNVQNCRWLVMTVKNTHPISVKFLVSPPASWDPLLVQRLHSHFISYDLATLYAIQAARELSSIKQQVQNIYRSGACAAGVKLHLSETAHSKAQYRLNSWQAAFYTGLADSDWFCNEGLFQIA